MAYTHRSSRRRAPPGRSKKRGRRQALELLAASPDGCTEALMLANGFTAELLVGLIHAGLASAQAERMIAADKMIELARVRITEQGRRSLAGASMALSNRGNTE
jgi:hypothetical protein